MAKLRLFPSWNCRLKGFQLQIWIISCPQLLYNLCMSQYLNAQQQVVLEFSLPENKLRTILSVLNLREVSKIENLSFDQKRVLILVAFREFLKGNLFLEEFSEIASHLKMLFPIESRSADQTDYETMIYEAADMSLYIRRFDPQSGSLFRGYMDTVWTYFNKYKKVLDGLPSKFSESSPLEKE